MNNLSDLEEAKFTLLVDTYLFSADDSYISARQALIQKRPRPFYWNAAQAIEKYCKFILLANDASVSGINHNIEECFRRTQEMFSSLIPDTIQPPNSADYWYLDATSGDPVRFWPPLETKHFISIISAGGMADSRYNLTPSVLRGGYLHLLDELLFLLRRLCFPFEYSKRYSKVMPAKTLRGNPNLQLLDAVYPLIRNSHDEYTRNSILVGNLSLNTQPVPLEDLQAFYLQEGWAFVNVQCAGDVADAAIDWFITEVPISGAIKAQLRTLSSTTDIDSIRSGQRRPIDRYFIRHMLAPKALPLAPRRH